MNDNELDPLTVLVQNKQDPLVYLINKHLSQKYGSDHPPFTFINTLTLACFSFYEIKSELSKIIISVFINSGIIQLSIDWQIKNSGIKVKPMRLVFRILRTSQPLRKDQCM